MSVSPETSSQNRDLGGLGLRRLMLKMSVSPETSSQIGDVEIAGLIFGSSKTGLSPETSSSRIKEFERSVLQAVLLKMQHSLHTPSEKTRCPESLRNCGSLYAGVEQRFCYLAASPGGKSEGAGLLRRRRGFSEALRPSEKPFASSEKA